ncbi:unnamed protein product [Clavelina lepadiformis]|uniref:F5/8 type C domain-containing protein n=1 Tax=Clavelina lepadiformis TaxID=159417 RepID=A0ABP0FK32_CLALP
MLVLIFVANILLLCVTSSSGQNNEICLTVSQRGALSQTSHQEQIVQGPPGRRGPQGLPGEKGDLGPTGSCQCDGIGELRGQLREFSENFHRLKLRFQNINKVTVCAVGMKDGRVLDQDISASSNWDERHADRFARLDFQKRPNSIGAWASGKNRGPPRAGEWIQVDLKSPTFLTGVVTQGRPSDYQNWVTSYKISFGNSTSEMQVMQENGSDITFQGNRDMNSYVTNMFSEPVVARYIRLIVQSWNNHSNLRLEYLIC